MTISPNEAGSMLAEVESIVAKVKQSHIYRLASGILMMWGGLVIVGNLNAIVAPRWAGWGWALTDLVGSALTIWMLIRLRAPGRRISVRLFGAFAIFFAFGWTWTEILTHFEPRQLAAFWPTYFLLAYALAGIWFGVAFTVIGVALSALVVAGYLWAGDGYTIYLAVINGGGLILCGYWMRRA